MPIQWVRQEDPKGCLIATAAMMASCTYQEARSWFRQHDPEAGNREASSYHFHQFVESHGWVQVGCRHKHNGVEIPWPPLFIEGSDAVACSVQPGADRMVAHSVLLLPDGSILDPDRSTPVLGGLSAYPDTFYIVGWRRKDET